MKCQTKTDRVPISISQQKYPHVYIFTSTKSGSPQCEGILIRPYISSIWHNYHSHLDRSWSTHLYQFDQTLTIRPATGPAQNQGTHLPLPWISKNKIKRAAFGFQFGRALFMTSTRTPAYELKRARHDVRLLQSQCKYASRARSVSDGFDFSMIKF